MRKSPKPADLAFYYGGNMANLEEVMADINEILRAYNYLDEEDENIEITDVPSLISHLLLLRIFTHEGMRFGISYDDVDDFCEFAIDFIYERESQGEDVSQIDIEDIIDAFRGQGVKH